MKKITLCFTILALCMVVKALPQQNIKQLDSIFNNLYSKNAFNGNVLIAKRGNVIYKRSFGLSNEETKSNLDENSVFELASVSKQFTAMGIVLLEEKGKLKYQDKLSSFFPELAFYGDVTILHLLHHTGGLPDYMDIMEKNWDKTKIATNKDIITVLSDYKPKALFEPGTRFEYSNTGYALLASVIEKVSGMSFPEYMKEYIFKPLRMENTFIYTRRYSPKKVNNYAYGYVYSDSLKTKLLPDDIPNYNAVIWLDGIMGDGTVNSTVNDLLKWDRALYTNQLVSKEAIEKIFTSGTIKGEIKTEYGFGWFFENSDDYGKIAWHNGGWPGYITHIERHLDNDVTIILLQNTYEGDIPNTLVRRIIYGKPLVEPERMVINLPEDQLVIYTGEYELQAGFNMSVTFDKGLKVQLPGQEKFDIYPESPTKFFLKVVDAQLEFFTDEKGKVNRLVLYQNGVSLNAPKIK